MCALTHCRWRSSEFFRHLGLVENWTATLSSMNIISGILVLFGWVMYTGVTQCAFAIRTMDGGLSFIVSLAMAEIAAAMPTSCSVQELSSGRREIGATSILDDRVVEVDALDSRRAWRAAGRNDLSSERYRNQLPYCERYRTGMIQLATHRRQYVLRYGAKRHQPESPEAALSVCNVHPVQIVPSVCVLVSISSHWRVRFVLNGRSGLRSKYPEMGSSSGALQPSVTSTTVSMKAKRNRLPTLIVGSFAHSSVLECSTVRSRNRQTAPTSLYLIRGTFKDTMLPHTWPKRLTRPLS